MKSKFSLKTLMIILGFFSITFVVLITYIVLTMYTQKQNDIQYFVIQISNDSSFNDIKYGEIWRTESIEKIPDSLLPVNYIQKNEYYGNSYPPDYGIIKEENSFISYAYYTYKTERKWNINSILYSRLITLHERDTLYISHTHQLKFDISEFPTHFCVQFTNWPSFTNIIYTDTLRSSNGTPLNLIDIKDLDTVLIKDSFNKNQNFIKNHETYARLIGCYNGEFYRSTNYHFIDYKLIQRLTIK